MPHRTHNRGVKELALGSFLVALCAVGACKKDDRRDDTRDMPAAINQAEALRGEQACRAYVERVCACARVRSELGQLKEQCDLAPGKVSSLSMVLRVNRSPRDADERVKTAATAQRIIRSCISEQARLDNLGCPRSE